MEKGLVLLGPEHDLSAWTGAHQRYRLDCLKFDAERDRLLATNGSILIEVPVGRDAAGEYPRATDLEEPTTCLLSTGIIKDALRGIVKTVHCPKPILQKVAVGRSNGQTVTHTTNLERDHREREDAIDDGTKGDYPPTDEVWPELSNATTVKLSPTFLHILADWASKHTSTGVTLHIQNTPGAPVVFTGKLSSGAEYRALIMPITETK